MAVRFFGGRDGTGSRVWSAGKSVTDPSNEEQLRTRIKELESLCTDVLVSGVDIGLPQHLLNQLWAAVGHGESPQAFQVDLPPAPPRPIEAPVQKQIVTDIASANVSSSTRSEPMPIPDIPLTTNSLTSATGDARPAPPQVELKPLEVKKTICVVDDDPMMLDVLTRILQRENFDLLMAGSGPEIIQTLADYSGAVDLLVTDYAMPHMQGRELADHVRRRFPAVKVLYQTGFSDLLFENRAELEEGEAFLEKPFTARGLREAIRMVLFGAINP